MKHCLSIFTLSALLACAPFNAVSAQEEYDDDDDDEDEIEVFDEALGEEEEITLPEGMTAELDSLLREWNNKSYLIPEGDCNENGFNPEFDKETYIHRLSRLPNVIEMPYNDVVRRMIDTYTGRLRRSVSIILGASNFYNGTNYGRVISLLIFLLRFFKKQFFYNVGKLRRKVFANF